MSDKKKGGLQLIVQRKQRFDEEVSLSPKSFSYTKRVRWTLLLACGCKKTHRGMSPPATKTACPNGHPTGFTPEVKETTAS